MPEPLFNLPTMAEVDADRRGSCELCGVAIDRKAHWGTRRFCSMACSNRAKNAARRKPRATCALCGKPAPIPRQKACSAKCAYTLRKLKTRKPRRCPVCDKEYFPKGTIRLKYCSRRCYDSVRTAEAFEEFACAKCGKTVRRRKVRTRERQYRFCGRECAEGFIAGEKHPWWRGGSDPNRGPKWQRRAEEIRKRDGYRCQRCGRTQEENGRRLDVDHIRPWRVFNSAEEANDPANLVALCGRCHKSKTSGAERKWLKGDGLEMAQYERAIKLPSVVLGSLA